MRDLLVGSTGFVGGNLKDSHLFSAVCHSADVGNYYGMRPDLCVYAGIPSAMFLADTDPDRDLGIMKNALINLREINPVDLVLISTIAVYPDSRKRNEESPMITEGLSAYGKNRLWLEEQVRREFPEALIIRLPALYGKGLKKNFLFDLQRIIPSMLKKEKYEELSLESAEVRDSYVPGSNGFYCLNPDSDTERLRTFFENSSFNALSFTDSRSRFQFYNLSRLWDDIAIALTHGLKVLNLCTPPVSAHDVYFFATGKEWQNLLNQKPYDYDLRSIHYPLFRGRDGYLCTKEEELTDIRRFLESGNGGNHVQMFRQ